VQTSKKNVVIACENVNKRIEENNHGNHNNKNAPVDAHDIGFSGLKIVPQDKEPGNAYQ
jgi:hypothetical protein